MVDGLLKMPDGTLGAVEVTTVGESAALETTSLLAGREWFVRGSKWAWHTWIPAGVSIREFERHLAPAIRAWEAAHIMDPRAFFPPVTHVDESVRWMYESRIRMRAFESKAPGAVYVIPEGGGGGAVDYELTELRAHPRVGDV